MSMFGCCVLNRAHNKLTPFPAVLKACSDGELSNQRGVISVNGRFTKIDRYLRYFFVFFSALFSCNLTKSHP